MAVIRAETVQKTFKKRLILAADFVKNITSPRETRGKIEDFVKNITSRAKRGRKFLGFVKNITSRANRAKKIFQIL